MLRRGMVVVTILALAAAVVGRERGYSKLENPRERLAVRAALPVGPHARLLQGGGAPDGTAHLPEAVANTVVRGLTATGVEDLLKLLNFECKPTKRDNGPAWVVAFGEYQGFLLLNDRVGETGTYTSIQLYSTFEPSVKPGLMTINSWNRDRRFCRAWQEDEKTAALATDLDLERGVTKGAIEQFLWIYTAQVSHFAKYLEPKP